MDYIATFYTHLSAMRTHKELKKRGADARLAPVPRKLSSSCGTCVFYTADAPMLECMDSDYEAVYGAQGENYTRLSYKE
ncbi:MAG: DUF3343 domain-containing protein [Eubacteriales bacterium]|nr:DUF3343 domain-containing protein [Eubacteriales bacterium]